MPRFIEINTKPSGELAYTLGVLKGDGCARFIKNHQCGIITLAQIRPEFSQSFEDAIKKLGFNANTFTQTHQGFKECIVYVTYGYSFKFVQWYKQLSFGDIERILSDNQDFIKAFVRGFFESEGCNCIKPRKESSAIKWQVYVAGRDKELYDFVERLLIKLGFKFNRYYYPLVGGHVKKPLHILRSNDQRLNHRFITTIAPCIKNEVVEPTAKIEIEWTKEMVISELQKFVEVNGYSPSNKNVPDTLRGACERHFETFNNAKKAAGIEIYPKGYNLDPKTGLSSLDKRKGFSRGAMTTKKAEGGGSGFASSPDDRSPPTRAPLCSSPNHALDSDCGECSDKNMCLEAVR